MVTSPSPSFPSREISYVNAMITSSRAKSCKGNDSKFTSKRSTIARSRAIASAAASAVGTEAGRVYLDFYIPQYFPRYHT